MEIISVNALITINETLFVQLLSFLIFLFLFNRVMIRPTLKTIYERNSYIREVKTMIEEKEEELITFTNALEAKKAKLRKEAFSQAQILENEANEIASQIFKESKEESLQARMEAEAQVRIEMDREKKNLEQQAEIITLSIIEKVLGRKMRRIGK